MNKFTLVMLFSIVMLISCANNNSDNKKYNTAETKSDKKIEYLDTKFEVIDVVTVDIEDDNYTNIDKYFIETLNAYKVHNTDTININGNKCYISSVYTINIDDESFYEKKDSENYIYISLWELNNNKANFISGFYPNTIGSEWVGDIISHVSNNVLEFEIERYSMSHSYINSYRFDIVESNNIIDFYLIDFSEKTPETDSETGEILMTEYLFDHDNIIMDNLDKDYGYYNF
ncbi:hypothetical protein [Brachyspira alvinipulli]|uniref:hypothetical protein n=1 Tax=Brachyspira alvinipulli TaxID=84379 RepID=UPI0004844D47|nr:hypothetical protein [Brachyspira alvinipulli]